MRSILFNVLWLLIEYGTKLILALVFNGILARALGVEEYGVFQYSISLVTMFSAFSFICGAEVIVPRLVNANAYKRRIILGSAFNVRLLFSFIGYIALLIFSYFQVSIREFYVITITGLVLFANEPFSVVSAWLQANTNSRPKSIFVIMGSLIRCSFAFVLYQLSMQDAIYYSIIWVIDAYILAIGLFYFYRKYNHEYFFYFSLRKSLFFLKRGLPFFIGLLFMYSFLRMDVFFLKEYVKPIDMGLYTASLQLFNTVIMLAPIISISLAPKLIYSINDRKKIKKRVFFISIAMASLSIFGSIIAYFLSDYAIAILFGNEFHGVSDIFKYMLFIIPLYYFNEGINLYFIKYKLGRCLTYKWLLALLVSLVLYPFTISTYGVWGAIIGLGGCYISILVYSILLLFYSK